MAATAYSTLPSSTHFGLDSNRDSYHSPVYGTHGSGVGSLVSHPYQYETSTHGTILVDRQQPSLYSNDYNQSSYANVEYSKQQQPQSKPLNKYSQQQPDNTPRNNYTQQQEQQQPHNNPSNKYTQQQPDNTPRNKYTQQQQEQQQQQKQQKQPKQQQQQLNGYSNSQISKNNDRSQAANNNNNRSRTTTKTRQPPQKKNMDNQQNSHAGTTQRHPPVPVDNQQHLSQSHLVRSEHQFSDHAPKQQNHKSQPPPQSKVSPTDHQISKSRAASPPALPSIDQRSSSNSRNKQVSEAARKVNNPPKELKLNKSSTIRAAAIKKKEETLEQKRKNKFFPLIQNKATPTQLKSEQASPQTDAEQSDIGKTQQKKKQSHSLPKTQTKSHSDGERTDTENKNRNKKKSHSLTKQRKSRHDGYQSEHNNNSSSDDDNHKRERSRSRKRATFSNSHLDKHPERHHDKHPDRHHDKHPERHHDQHPEHHHDKDPELQQRHYDKHPELHPHHHPQLPQLHHGRMPPHYGPYPDYPLPPGHPLRGRFPPYGPYPDRYPIGHLHEEADGVPPYLAPYHDPYDPFFDYQKRKAKPKRNKDETNRHTNHDDHGGTSGHDTDRDDDVKSQLSRKSKHKNTNNHHGGRKSRRNYEENLRPRWPPGYRHPGGHREDDDDMLDIWRQERNDYLKKQFKPTIHDVLYSQQWMKSDSYLENQRRRALRDAQGYYFPYKKYTLKDYKDMQRLSKQNPFADVDEITIDRKELAKKRQEYGALIERQMVDNPGARYISQREMEPRKPWHLSGGDPADAETVSKRERALEYAKVQVKYHPVDSRNDHSNESDPTEHYVHNHFSEMNNNRDRSNKSRTDKIHQSSDDYN